MVGKKGQSRGGSKSHGSQQIWQPSQRSVPEASQETSHIQGQSGTATCPLWFQNFQETVIVMYSLFITLLKCSLVCSDPVLGMYRALLSFISKRFQIGGEKYWPSNKHKYSGLWV